MTAAPRKMIHMENIGVPQKPLVLTAMLMVMTTGDIAQTIAKQPQWEKDLVAMASPAYQVAWTLQILTPEVREFVEMICTAVNPRQISQVNVMF